MFPRYSLTSGLQPVMGTEQDGLSLPGFPQVLRSGKNSWTGTEMSLGLLFSRGDPEFVSHKLYPPKSHRPWKGSPGWFGVTALEESKEHLALSTLLWAARC